MSATRPGIRKNEARRGEVPTLAVVRAAQALQLSQKNLDAMRGKS